MSSETRVPGGLCAWTTETEDQWARATAPCLPLLDSGVFVGALADGGVERLPVFALDTSRRPDVADLINRVIPQEGAARARELEWLVRQFDGDVVLLFDAVMDAPVSCAFRVGFSCRMRERELEALLHTDKLVFVADRLPSTLIPARSLVLYPPLEGVREVLRSWGEFSRHCDAQGDR